MDQINEHLKFMAEFVVGELNKLGIIKDAQCNHTVKMFVAEKLAQYCKNNKVGVGGAHGS